MSTPRGGLARDHRASSCQRGLVRENPECALPASGYRLPTQAEWLRSRDAPPRKGARPTALLGGHVKIDWEQWDE
jgi:hypothetical protein